MSNNTDKGIPTEEGRMRKNNGENKSETKNNMMVKGVQINEREQLSTTTLTIPNISQMMLELDEFMPDSTTLFERERLKLFRGQDA